MELTKGDRRMWAAVIAAGAAMVLCFAGRSTAMTVPDKLPCEPPGLVRTAETEPVNINTAGLEELMTLRGIGEARARAIIGDRESNGPYRYPEDLIRVKGIGEGILADILEQITTGGQANAQNIGG